MLAPMPGSKAAIPILAIALAAITACSASKAGAPVPTATTRIFADGSPAQVKRPNEGTERAAAPERTPSALPACVEGAPPEGSAAARLSWMSGTWASEEGGARTVERWCAGEGGALVGDNHTSVNGRVVHTERLRIEARGNALVYIASPSGQATTEFTGDVTCGTEAGRNCSRTCEAVFRNAAHDFPNEITYGRCLQNEFLVATIHGKSGERRASWEFRRSGP